ncbi:MAG TPA: ATP-binding protein [Candidatus Eremiobacteraceae bacterium]|nr:ATP-binding protein [Candidatus Eremiobacteraceae bacterium]
MTRPMKIGGYLIVQLEGQLQPADATGELIENALDANASLITINVSRGSMSVCDNGDGTDDPNLIFTPSMSKSRFKKGAIGSKAIGAKQACATFGRTWEVQTVVRGHNEYRRHKITWHEDGPLPSQYEGPALPANRAPLDIRHGGTRITVTNRQDGFPSLRLERLCDVLEERYRPCLNSGELKIIVRNPETGFDRRLKNAAYEKHLFASPIRELEGVAANRAFKVRFGTLKEYHRALSYCHYVFGPRVLMTDQRLGQFALPAGCYIDVILSDDWKSTLSTNKNRIDRYFDSLVAALDSMLADWITEQRKEAAEFKINLMCGQLSDVMNTSIALLDDGVEGESKAEREARSKRGERVEEPPRDEIITVKRERRKRRPPAGPGGQLGTVPVPHRKTARLKIDADPRLGHNLFGGTFSTSGDEVVIRLNTGPHQREIAEYFRRGKIDDLHAIAVVAFGVLVGQNPKQFTRLFAGLRKRGYQIDESDHHTDITTMVSNFMLNARYGQSGSIKQRLAG